MSKDAPATSDNEKSALPVAALAGAGAALLALVAIPAPFLLPALRKHCLPYVAANAQQLELLEKACRRRGVKRLVDLGSGDGVVCVELAKRLGVQVRALACLVHRRRMCPVGRRVREVTAAQAAGRRDVERCRTVQTPRRKPHVRRAPGAVLPRDAILTNACEHRARWQQTRLLELRAEASGGSTGRQQVADAVVALDPVSAAGAEAGMVPEGIRCGVTKGTVALSLRHRQPKAKAQ